MNPNQPDPNNPNSSNPVAPDLSSTPPPSTTPLPDLSSQAPLQTPSAAASFDPIQPNAPTSPTISPPLPAPAFDSTPSAPQAPPEATWSAPEPTPSGSAEPTLVSDDTGPTPTFTPPSTPQPTSTPIQSGSTDQTGGFSWPSSTNPPQAQETPGVPQPGLSDLATTPPGSPPIEAQPALNPLSSEPTSEPAPSDLSHLVNPAQEATPASAYAPPATATAQPETLVPSTATGGAEVPNLPTEGNHSGIPKWVIGVGAVLLLVVVAASAYFILGIGRNTPGPESAPATTEQPATAPPAVQTQPIPTIGGATSSAGFGTLPGGGSTAGATSAADLLRQRQGL